MCPSSSGPMYPRWSRPRRCPQSYVVRFEASGGGGGAHVFAESRDEATHARSWDHQRVSCVARLAPSESCRARSSRRDLAPRAREHVTRKARRTPHAPPKRTSSGPHRQVLPKHRTAIADVSCRTRSSRRETHERTPVAPRARPRAARVTRAARDASRPPTKERAAETPEETTRPPTEGRTGRVPRNPVDEGATRSRVRPRALHRRFAGRAPFGAHASKKPRSNNADRPHRIGRVKHTKRTRR